MTPTNPQGFNQPGFEPARREDFAGHPTPTEPTKAGNVMTAVTEKVQDVASGAKHTVEEWGSSAAEAADQAKQKAQKLASRAAHTAENLGEELTALIRRYPMAALLCGFGIGFLLSQIRRR
jgi:hypothetical protein